MPKHLLHVQNFGDTSLSKKSVNDALAHPGLKSHFLPGPPVINTYLL